MNQYSSSAIIFVALLACASPVMAAVTVVGSANGYGEGDDTAFSYAINVPQNTDLAVVGISNRDDRGTSYARFSVNDPSHNMTFIVDTEDTTMDERVQFFYYVNPPAGNQTIYINMTNPTRHKASGCILLNGVDLAKLSSEGLENKILGGFHSNNPNPEITFTGTEAPTGSLVISALNTKGRNLSAVGQTEHWNVETAYEHWFYTNTYSRHGGGSAPGSSVNGVSVGWQPNDNWGMAAIVIPAAYTGPNDIAPSTLDVNDNAPNGTVLGELVANDPDGQGPYTWTLPNNAGGRFALSATETATPAVDVLIADAGLIDAGQSDTHTIRVGVKNALINTVFEQDIVISVYDTTPPVIGEVTATRRFVRWGEFVSFSVSITDNVELDDVSMSLDGTALTFNNQVGDVFTWGWNVPLDAPDADLDLLVTAQDTAGNGHTLEIAHFVVVDNTPPDIMDFERVSSPYAKVGDIVEVRVSLLDANGIVEYPTVTLAGIDGGEPTIDGFRYTWEIGITAAFEEGSADILVTAYDPAGNEALGSGPAMVTIDNTPPSITSFASSHQYAKLGDVVTLQASIFDSSGLDGLPKMYLHGNQLASPTVSGNNYYWQFTVTNALQQGDAVLQVEAVDRAGNDATASPASTILVIDYTSPNFSNFNVAPSRAKGGTALTLSARVIDNYGLAGTPQMNINGWPVSAPSQSGYEYTWNFIVPSSPPPAEGPAEISILATDLAGNTRVFVDTSQLIYDPNAPVFSDVVVSPTLVRLGHTVEVDVHVYDISALDVLPTLLVSGGAATHTGSTDLGNGNARHTFSYVVMGTTPEGDAPLTFWGRDILGNEEAVTFSNMLMVDKTPPVVSNASVTPSLSRSGGVVTITFDVVDALTEVHGNPTVTVNGASASFHSKTGDHYAYRYTVRSPEQDPDGPAVIVVNSRDTVGNSGSATFNDMLTINNSLPVLSDLVVFPNVAREGGTVTIGFHASDATGLGALPVVRVNGNPATFIDAQGSTFEYRYTARAAYDDEGYAVLYIRIVDGVGNVLESESTGLLLVDFTPPSGTLTINDGAVLTRSTDVVLGITVDDGEFGSGATEMSFSDDGLSWSAWEPIEATRSWQLKGGQGHKMVYMRLRDRAGNVSTLPVNDTIALKPHELTVEREGDEDVKALPGNAVVLEVTPRNIFGSIQAYEWYKDGEPVEGFGPVLTIDSFEEQDMGVYVCKVWDEVEMAQSPPFQLGLSEETPVPVLRRQGLVLLAMLLGALGVLFMRRRTRSSVSLLVILSAMLVFSGIAAAEVTVVYSARVESEMTFSDQALTDLAIEQGAIEIWTRRDDGSVRRQLARLGEAYVANPGFSSHHREEFAAYRDKGLDVEHLKDGTEKMQVPLSDEVVLIYTQNQDKGITEPSFEMRLVVDGETILSEKRYEEFADGYMRPTMLRVDYPGGAMIQVFEFTTTPPPPLPPVYLRKVGVDDDEKSDTYPKSWATKDGGDTQTREVQFIVPPQGLGNLGFDSGWVPGGSGPDPGGFIIQVRINASAGYTYDAAANGTFNLDINDLLGLGPASGNWGFYFGAEFFMKAAFNLPPILGFEIPPFIVDIPYVPDFNMVASDRDVFNSWLLESVSTVRDEAGRTQVTSVDLVALLLTQGVLPELPGWVPLPRAGAALDVGAIANGELSCDSIALTDGTVFTLEGQELPIFVPQSGYHAIAQYNENAELNLGVKFYPYVFFSWFSFGFSWPTDFDDPDNLLARLEWLPISHSSFPFSNAEINFTGQPSTQPANDWFTQRFQPIIDTNNVSHKQVRFTPNMSNNFYTACIGNATAYRTDPAGGVTVTLGDNDYVPVTLTDNKQVSLYGNSYDTFYIGSNGYITFNAGDATADGTLENHFDQPRISGLFLDLHPDEGGTVSYKQLPNRVVVTYHQVRLSNIIVEQTASVQIEMFFDGRIVITWLQLDTYVGLIGLSRGNGVPEEYQKSRFTNYPSCLTDIVDEYGVRVNFSPPEVLAHEPRWRVGTGSWLSTNTYTSVPLGENWVYCNYIPVYWNTPESIMTHSLAPDVFVDLAPVWTRATGTVTVSTQPGTASWVLTDADGQTYTGTGHVVLDNVPTGMATVEWQPLPTYSLPAPATQQAMLYPDMSIAFFGNYPPIIGEGQATVTVTLGPALANAAGAQWRVNEGDWLESGAEVIVPDGDGLIEFRDIANWTRPVSQLLFFQRDTTTELVRAYARHHGSVLVDPNPGNAPWVLTDGDGVEHAGVGYTGLQNIPTGNNLSVLWGDVAGYNLPAPNPTLFDLPQSPARRVVGAYIPIIGDGEGIVRVTMYPPAAVNAGAQWRLFGGEWLSSGGMAASPDGEQTILFGDLPGWIAPATMTVDVVRDITNEFDATYERLTGTVVIGVEPSTGWWTLTDMDGGVHSGLGAATLTDVPSGDLSIHWGEIEGYAPPQPNPSAFTLEAGETLDISGAYVEAIVSADFNAYPLVGVPPLEVNFTDMSHSTTKDIVEWRWYFGDGRTSTDRHPAHVYRQPGTYTVTLTVTTYDQMDVISKKHLITVSEGMPTGGFIAITLLTLLLGAGGARVVVKRRR